MATTSFNGPVRSENGFQVITINASSGTVSTTATYGTSATVANLTASGSLIKLTGLPIADPVVAGAVWSNAGVLTLSAG